MTGVSDASRRVPRTGRGERTRDELMAAATEVFWDRGYVDTRVADIVERAGVAHGTFYTYFDSKEAVLWAIAADLNEAIAATARGVRAEVGGDEVRAIELANRRYLEVYLANRKVMRLMEEVAAFNPEMRAGPPADPGAVRRPDRAVDRAAAGGRRGRSRARRHLRRPRAGLDGQPLRLRHGRLGRPARRRHRGRHAHGALGPWPRPPGVRTYSRKVIEAKGTNGRVTFDGVLVTIHRGGARSWVRGSGMRSIPARALVAVDLQPAGFGRGWIRFAVESGDEDDLDDAYDDEDDLDPDDEEADDEDGAGGGAGDLLGLGGWIGRSRRPGQAGRPAGADRFDPAKDPNTVLFTRGRQRAFEDVRREVKTAMWEVGRRGGAVDDEFEDDDDGDHTPTQPLPAHDPVRELRQLGQLLRDGVLSQAEFERAKARLLDRI